MIQPLATKMSAMGTELSRLNNLTTLDPSPETLATITNRVGIIEDKQTKLFRMLNLKELEVTSKDPIDGNLGQEPYGDYGDLGQDPTPNGERGSGQVDEFPSGDEDEDTTHQTTIKGTENTSKSPVRIRRSPTDSNSISDVERPTKTTPKPMMDRN